jgi:hypothetical protein
MAIYLRVKAPSAVTRYEWAFPVRDGDGLATFVPTVSSGTAVIDSYETEGDTGVLIVSGGTAGAVTVIGLVATTNEGETLTDTAYLPVIASTNALGNTGTDIAAYILRKVTGNGETASADELNDCLERVSDMLATWKLQGADLGIPLPVTTSTEFICEDAFIQAVKANGILAVMDLYDNYNPSAIVVEQARRGLQIIKASLLPTDERPAVYY